MLISGALLVILQFASKNGPKLPAAFAAAASGGRSLLALNLHTLGFPNSLILFLPSHWPTLARFPPNQTLTPASQCASNEDATLPQAESGGWMRPLQGYTTVFVPPDGTVPAPAWTPMEEESPVCACVCVPAVGTRTYLPRS